ncbi:hypothetical protein LZ30DRAFT_699399 [Colletotrichum cereale]|nr:hypothetical protein LZ30DRAFT_699399 [Colletotrichum cereale]
MPRSGPNPEDLDFEVHVDPSCLNTPAHEAAEPDLMEDDSTVPAKPEAEEVPGVETEEEDKDKDETAVAAAEEVIEPEVEEDTKEEGATEPGAVSGDAAEAVVETGSEEPVEATSDEPEPASESTETADEKEAQAEAVAETEVPPVQDAESAADTPADDDMPAADEATNDTTQDEPDQPDAKSDKDLSEETSELAAAEDAKAEEPEPLPESEPALEAEEEEPPQAESEPQAEDQPREAVEGELAAEEPEPLVEETREEEAPHPEPEAEPEAEVEIAATAEPDPEPEAEAGEEAERGRSLEPAAEITPTLATTAEEASEDHEEPAAVRETSRSSSSVRRDSERTEALIHAAAKEVLERLEAQTMETMRTRSSHSRQDSTGSTNAGTELHYDVRSEGTRRESYNTESRASRRESYKTESRASRRESYNTRPRSSRRESELRPHAAHAEDGADSSSQHGDSDVFSDRSPRSSLGSFDGHVVDHLKDAGGHRSSKRSSHMSDDVSVSDMSYYDKDDFVPTIRGANRMPFRSPSDVRALQYSSPAPSVTGSYSPRPAKRSQMPTISRLGSPTVSGQYTTAKGRKTPTRFNPKKEPAPLVLLHVTLLPLRWQWAEVLEQTSSDMLTPEAKTLREAWHHLHDRVADTVCERGILLSHPQEDYEILEERLLEALDLPLRRRARVLECGHYIGPSNEMTLGEDGDSDEDDDYAGDAAEGSRRRRRSGALVKTHWCETCRHDIRYEPLGPGKIFRIKVYASNGLMRTGAWAACWKEMERVDVEIEPVVESAVLDELERLVFAQSQQLQLVKLDHPAAVLESTEPRDRPEDRRMSDDDDDDFGRRMPSSVERRDTRSPDRGIIPALEEPPRDEEEASPHPEESGNLLEPSYVDSDARVPVSSPPPPAADDDDDIRSPSPAPVPRYDASEERRLRDEERMREIYGHPPPPEPQHHHYEPAPEPQPEPRQASFSARSPSPSVPQQQQPEPQQAPQQAPQAFQNAGLGELLLEAARVFMQDKKNLAIVVMSLLVLFMAVRPAPREVRDWDGQFVEHVAPVMSEPPAAAPPLMETVRAVVESVASSEAPAQVIVDSTPEVEAAEHHREVPVAEEATASIAGDDPVSSTSTSDTTQTSAVEEETYSPAASPSSSSPVEAVAPAPTPVHETITTRELVRIIETVTETVKAVVTETEVVRVQATPSVAPEVPVEEEAAAAVQVEEPLEDTTAAARTEEPLEDAAAEEAPAAETALPVEEPVDELVAEDQEVVVEEKEMAERKGAEEEEDHDEL